MPNRSDEELLIGGLKTTRPVVDQFLLAIIDAHRGSTEGQQRWRKERERRLAAAKKALFGEGAASGPKLIDDREALHRMGRGRYRDLSYAGLAKLGFKPPEMPRRPRSDRQLAKEAAETVYGSCDPSVVDRLRRAFGKEGDYWVEIARSHDDVPETIERQILISLKRLLAKTGILMVLPGSSGSPVS